MAKTVPIRIDEAVYQEIEEKRQKVLKEYPPTSEIYGLARYKNTWLDYCLRKGYVNVEV